MLKHFMPKKLLSFADSELRPQPDSRIACARVTERRHLGVALALLGGRDRRGQELLVGHRARRARRHGGHGGAATAGPARERRRGGRRSGSFGLPDDVRVGDVVADGGAVPLGGLADVAAQVLAADLAGDGDLLLVLDGPGLSEPVGGAGASGERALDANTDNGGVGRCSGHDERRGGRGKGQRRSEDEVS